MSPDNPPSSAHSDWRALSEGYYAIVDPRDADRMTYWRRKTGRGNRPELVSWPLNVDQTVRVGYTMQITAAISADPVAAGKRFAELTTRCCMCSRRLRDEKSKVSGIGPECRKSVPGWLVERYLVPAVERAHAAAHHEQGGLFA